MSLLDYLTLQSPLVNLQGFRDKIISEGKIFAPPTVMAYFAGNGNELASLAFIRGKWRVQSVRAQNHRRWMEKYQEEIDEALLLASSLYPGGKDILSDRQKQRKVRSGSWRRPERSRLGKSKKKKVAKPQKRK